MRVTVNDQPVELAEGAAVTDLLRKLGLERATVAVERNRELVPRAQHGSERLADGDRLDIVTLVGGG